jgi:hypothetical protein
MPGGFHPFHAGHAALYNSARRAFPDAEVFVAATNDTSTRPFPFALKEKLANLAGVEPGHFVQVKSPFRAEEITAQFDPAQDRLIFVRSDKDSTKPPQAGGNKKDGSPAYLQPLLSAKKLEPFGRHAYIAYLPTVEFGPGMTSATEIRAAWPNLNEKRKTALVMSLYPKTQTNPQLAATVVKMLDTAIVSESVNTMTANTSGAGAGMKAGYADRENQPPMESHTVATFKKIQTTLKKSGVKNTKAVSIAPVPRALANELTVLVVKNKANQSLRFEKSSGYSFEGSYTPGLVAPETACSRFMTIGIK